MRIDYDPDADAVDITLREGIVARTVEIDSGTLVDVDAQGRALTIEIIRLTRSWPLDEIFQQFEISPDDEAILRSLKATGMITVTEPQPLVLA